MGPHPQVIIAGGGTGGHLFPGLAVAQELRDRGIEVGFVGTRKGIEARVLPKEDYPLFFIDVAGLKGKGIAGALRGLLLLPLACASALSLLRAARPLVVIGVGGYASGPTVLLAALLGIPTAVLEQNSVPGVTNRILSRVVRRVFTAFPEAATYFPQKKVRLLGNPIRRGLLAGPAPGPAVASGKASDVAPLVLVLGGSQGAHAVNELMMDAVRHLAAEQKKGKGRVPRLLHQTGIADEHLVRACYEQLGLGEADARVVPFIDDMQKAYAACDLVVGRAGATTLAEITALGLPSVLIPLPTAADDHQTKNARWLVGQGAARVLAQAATDGQQLGALIAVLCDEGGEQERGRMAQRSRSLGRPNAAGEVADEVLRMASF